MLFCGDCETDQGCYGESHIDGLPLMGAMWKVRSALKETHGDEPGGSIADALFLGWMNAFDQDRIHSIIEHQWLVLDDVDRNLSNGTPNLLSIDRGFAAHGFKTYQPGAGVKISICK